MKIKDLPKEIQILAELRALQYGKEFNHDNTVRNQFVFESTLEGQIFWQKIADGDFSPYYELYRVKTAPGETQTEWQPTKGEMVEISDSGTSWIKRKFFGYIEKAEKYKYVAYSEDETSTISWKYCRKIQHEFTIDEARAIISESKGIELEKIIIK